MRSNPRPHANPKRHHITHIIALFGLTAFMVSAAPDSPQPFLGISVSPVSATLRSQLNLSEQQGVVIAWVGPNTPAAIAGLRQHDILLTLQETQISSESDLAKAVMRAKANTIAICHIIRQAKPQNIPVTLGQRPAHAKPITSNTAVRPVSMDVQIFGLSSPPSNMTQAVSSFMIHDGTFTTKARRDAHGELHIIVRDHHGATIFKGPASTPEQRKALPEPVRKNLDKALTPRKIRLGVSPKMKPRSGTSP